MAHIVSSWGAWDWDTECCEPATADKFSYYLSPFHQYHSRWCIDSPTLLTLSSSSVVIITHQLDRFHNLHPTDRHSSNLIIIYLTHLIQLIINNFSHMFHLTNLISHVHLTITNNSNYKKQVLRNTS